MQKNSGINFVLGWEFPGSPEVRTQYFHCGGPSSISGQGTKILQATWGDQKVKKKNSCAHRNKHKYSQEQHTLTKKLHLVKVRNRKNKNKKTLLGLFLFSET